MNLCSYKSLPIVLLFVSSLGMAADQSADPNFNLVSQQVKDICHSVANVVIPPQPPSAEKCDAVNFYYGFNQPADYAKARQCAYATQDYAVLTMIYANGKGVPRDWNLAIHFACQAGFAPSEIEGRVLHLVRLRDQQAQAENFDICDDVTSGYMMGVCTSYQQKLADSQRNQQLASLMNGWSDTDKQAFAELQRAANAFFRARSENEVDLSGSDRAAAQLEEQGSLEDDWVSSLKNIAAGHLPTYTGTQAIEADQQLNQVYRKIEDNANFSLGTVNREGIKKTQLLWLQYRDAWVHFGKIKYPQISADNWKTWATEKRVKMLQDLAEDN